MKIKKQLVRDPVTGAKVLIRSHHIAVDEFGNEHVLENSRDSSTIEGRKLPAGWKLKQPKAGGVRRRRIG